MDDIIFSDNNFMPLWHWVKREHHNGESDSSILWFLPQRCGQEMYKILMIN